MGVRMDFLLDPVCIDRIPPAGSAGWLLHYRLSCVAGPEVRSVSGRVHSPCPFLPGKRPASMG
ncbi:hypothetical protein ASZ90_009439 [hydrocarbon metagenome]|uniref:Uncharacterized protein n=1 Tax=hydrocarbon metagenome TaxID=938273 RepID=A0A0W8FJM5_9ZZZZ